MPETAPETLYNYFEDIKLMGTRIIKEKPHYATTSAQVYDQQLCVDFFIKEFIVTENKFKLRGWIPGNIFVSGEEVHVTDELKTKIANALLYVYKKKHNLYRSIPIYQ